MHNVWHKIDMNMQNEVIGGMKGWLKYIVAETQSKNTNNHRWNGMGSFKNSFVKLVVIIGKWCVENEK